MYLCISREHSEYVPDCRLLLTVYDFDKVTRNDFLGLAYLETFNTDIKKYPFVPFAKTYCLFLTSKQESHENTEPNDKELGTLSIQLKYMPSAKLLMEYDRMKLFGRPLMDVCERERCMVPSFVTKCMQSLDNSGYITEGIFRIPQSDTVVKGIKRQLDTGCVPDMMSGSTITTLTGDVVLTEGLGK